MGGEEEAADQSLDVERNSSSFMGGEIKAISVFVLLGDSRSQVFTN